MKKRKGGRPPKFNPEVAARVCEAVRAGVPRKDAAAYAGINDSTLYRWTERGRKSKKGAFWEFCQQVKKAESDAVVRNVAVIQKAAEREWQAAAWWLERRRPDDFGRKEKREHSYDQRKPQRVVHVDEEFRRLYADHVAGVSGTDGEGQPVHPASTNGSAT